MTDHDELARHEAERLMLCALLEGDRWLTPGERERIERWIERDVILRAAERRAAKDRA